MIFGHSVRSVRRDRRDNQSVAFPVTDELFDVGHRLSIGLVIGDRKSITVSPSTPRMPALKVSSAIASSK